MRESLTVYTYGWYMMLHRKSVQEMHAVCCDKVCLWVRFRRPPTDAFISKVSLQGRVPSAGLWLKVCYRPAPLKVDTSENNGNFRNQSLPCQRRWGRMSRHGHAPINQQFYSLPCWSYDFALFMSKGRAVLHLCSCVFSRHKAPTSFWV